MNGDPSHTYNDCLQCCCSYLANTTYENYKWMCTQSYNINNPSGLHKQKVTLGQTKKSCSLPSGIVYKPVAISIKEWELEKLLKK